MCGQYWLQDLQLYAGGQQFVWRVQGVGLRARLCRRAATLCVDCSGCRTESSMPEGSSLCGQYCLQDLQPYAGASSFEPRSRFRGKEDVSVASAPGKTWRADGDSTEGSRGLWVRGVGGGGGGGVFWGRGRVNVGRRRGIDWSCGGGGID